MNKTKVLHLLLKNQKGIALLMVLTSITILTALLAEFTFETKVNKIKSYNLQEKLQAKLNAEAGLAFAMARLRLYKESFNTLEGNKDAKNFVGPQILNQIWEVPFVYPIPTNAKMSSRAKAAIEKFSSETILQGQLQVTIRNISNLINLNLLRAPIVTESNNENQNNNNSNNNENSEDTQQFTPDYQVFELLRNGIQNKRETDDFFDDKYASLDPNVLISSIKYFISEKTTFDDANTAILVNDYDNIPMALKHTPFQSKSELYLLAGWDDELISLIENEVTAHGAVMLDLNKINDKMLRVLIPNINDEQIKEFFEYRDDPENPHFINSLEDFRKYIVDTARVMEADTFDDRFDKLKKNGLLFGPSPTLFEVKAVGKFNRATYNLTAVVTIPAEPEPSQEDIQQAQQNNQQEGTTTAENNNENENENENENQNNTGQNNSNNQEAKPIKLMEPRIVEVFIE